MTWSTRIKYICILLLLVGGAWFPPLWIFLIMMVLYQNGKKPMYSTPMALSELATKEEKEEHALRARIYTVNMVMYRQSPKWNRRRKLILKRDMYTCHQCGATDIPLDVHHMTYERMGDEDLKDLISVCRPCHDKIHEHYGYDKMNKFPLLEK